MRLRPHSFWPLFLAAPFGLLACALARLTVDLPSVYEQIVAVYPALEGPFLAGGVPQMLRLFAAGTGAVAVFLLVASFAGILVRRYGTLWLLHKSYLLVYALVACYVFLVTKITSLIMIANVRLDGQLPTPQTLFILRWHYLWPAFAIVLVTGLLHVCSWRRILFTLYTGIHDETPAIGDRIIENLLGNGRDPRFRKGVLASVGAHVFVILVLPWLLSLMQHVTPYLVPKGSGTPTVGDSAAPVKVVRAKPAARKPRPKFIVNLHSAISFHIPDLDESKVGQEVEASSQLTYVADTSRVASQPDATGTGGSGGAHGKGHGKRIGAGGGTTGGWPDGMEGAVVRFIRLEYNGAGWDDGMDSVSRSDLNFLDEFRKITGFPVSTKPESHSIALLRKYPKGFAPPFVYMRGIADINVSASDIKTLRDYLLDGGMLFADCGSPQWNQSFRTFVSALLPGEALVPIADDDPIFQEPFHFPNGAPPLWHHGGTRAMGVKYRGRWVLFYHPGDLHDGWKTGHNGLSPELARGSYEMGVNIVYYAFSNYLEQTRKYRK